jgi:SRSO17 transposase
MELQLPDVITWKEDFEQFCNRYRSFFGRVEVQQQATTYIQTLMRPIERRNGWTMAEASDQNDPQPIQRLLRTAVWDETGAINQMQQQVKESFATKDGIFVVDESGIVKDGDCSVGVARQYCGSVGKVENCQVGVYLAYASEHGHTFLGCRLYMPVEWFKGQERREKAHVPSEIEFKTKPQLALDMLRPLLDADFPGEWVAADSVYGDSPEFRNELRIREQKFVLGATSTLPVWTRPPWLCGKKTRNGTVKWNVSSRGPQKRTLAQVAAAMKTFKWKRMKVFDGSKGWRVYDWAAKRVHVSEEGFVGPCLWMLVRRSISDPNDCAYFLCNAPVNVSLLTLARVAANRWRVEQCFEESKGETGLDQYQVRTWQGWHRHMLLSMLAHLFLAELKKKYRGSDASPEGVLTVPEIRRLLEIALPLPARSAESKWRWSLWRRRHNQKARLSHYRRRGHVLTV